MSDKQNSEIEFVESDFKKNFKALFDKVKIINALSLFVIITLIVVLSIYSIGWSPEKINYDTYVVNITLLIFLGIYGLFFGEQIGNSFFKSSVRGAYQFAREGFLRVINLIVNKGYSDSLPDYLPYRYQKDCEGIYKMKLLSVKVFNTNVLNLSDSEVLELKNGAIKKEWGNGKVEYFSRLSEEQFNMVQKIREGKIIVDYIDDYNFYLMDTPSSDVQLVTKIKNVEKDKVRISTSNRVAKISMIIIVSIITAGIMIDQANGQSTDQTIINLFSRLSTLTTSIVSGINTARLMSRKDIEVYRYKTSYIETFYASIENGTFKVEDYNEKAKLEYELEHKGEKENE